jgi:hypothetical protein
VLALSARTLQERLAERLRSLESLVSVLGEVGGSTRARNARRRLSYKV